MSRPLAGTPTSASSSRPSTPSDVDRRALESVFAQTFTDFEVIVVDDGSTDGTADGGRGVGRPVTLIRQPNRGPGGRAEPRRSRASRGRLVAFLDADDVLAAGASWRAQVAYFDAFPETGLLHTAVDRPAPDDAARPRVPDRRSTPPRHVFCDLFHTDFDINTLTVMVPRATCSTGGGFDERREVHVEDWDLWLRIAATEPGRLPARGPPRSAGRAAAMSADIEKTFGGQARSSRRSAPLCGRACPGTASRPGACLARRWHRFYWELGYARLRDGRRAGGARRVPACAAPAGRSRARPSTAVGARPSPPSAGAPRPCRVLGASGSRTRSRRRTPSGAATRRVDDTVYWRTRAAPWPRRLHDLDDAALPRAGRRALPDPVRGRVADELRDLPSGLRAAADRSRDSSSGSPRPGTLGAANGCTRASAITRARRPAARRRLDEGGRLHQHRLLGHDLAAPADAAPAPVPRRRRASTASTRRWTSRRPSASSTACSSRTTTGCSATSRRGSWPPTVAGRACSSATRSSTASWTARSTADASLAAARPRRRGARRSSTRRPGRRTRRSTGSERAAIRRTGRRRVQRHRQAARSVVRPGATGLRAASTGPTVCRAVPRHPRVRVVTDPDATPCLAVADALVTDHSSIGFEFTLLDRPIVVVDCPDLIAARPRRRRPRWPRCGRRPRWRRRERARWSRSFVSSGNRPCTGETGRRLARHFFYRPGTATARGRGRVYDVLARSSGTHAAAAPVPSSERAESALVTLSEEYDA